MTRILTLDPGIDVTGWAAFELPGRPILATREYRAAYLAHGSLRSRIEDTTDARLRALHDRLGDVLAEQLIDHAYLELPAITGSYARTEAKEQGRGFHNKYSSVLHQAIGGLLLSCNLRGLPVTGLPAIKTRKGGKSAFALTVWPELGNGKSNADERDALHLGCWILQRSRLWPDAVGSTGQPFTRTKR